MSGAGRYLLQCADQPAAATSVVGQVLKSYDPNARDGRGEMQWTQWPTEALVFRDAASAVECWRQVPTVHPQRPDGKPNRPLTAFSVATTPAPVDLRAARLYGCQECAEIERAGGFGPAHDPSQRCESGAHPHCTCDWCF